MVSRQTGNLWAARTEPIPLPDEWARFIRPATERRPVPLLRVHALLEDPEALVVARRFRRLLVEVAGLACIDEIGSFAQFRRLACSIAEVELGRRLKVLAELEPTRVLDVPSQRELLAELDLGLSVVGAIATDGWQLCGSTYVRRILSVHPDGSPLRLLDDAVIRLHPDLGVVLHYGDDRLTIREIAGGSVRFVEDEPAVRRVDTAVLSQVVAALGPDLVIERCSPSEVFSPGVSRLAQLLHSSVDTRIVVFGSDPRALGVF